MPISLTIEPAEVIFGKDLSATVKVKVERQDKFDEQVVIAVTPVAPAGLPAGITAAVKPIVKATNEIDIVFTANAQAPLGEFTVVLTGQINQNNINTTQPTPGITLRLRSMRHPVSAPVSPISLVSSHSSQQKAEVSISPSGTTRGIRPSNRNESRR